MEKKTVQAEVPERKDAEGNVKQPQLGPVAVEVDFPSTLDEAKNWCGEEALLSNAFANWRVTIQSNIRSALKRGEAEGDIQNRLSSAVMGVAQTGGKVDAEAAFKAKFLQSDPETRKKMIAQLRELASEG